MVVNKQRWYPDTCGCIVIQAYDTVTDTFSIDSYENVCPQHASLVGNTARYNAMKGDNQRKNQFLGTAFDNFAAQLTESDGQGGIQLKKGITFNWSFSGTGDTRVLTISFSGITLTAQQKTTLQNLADTKFGAGKVVVQ